MCAVHRVAAADVAGAVMLRFDWNALRPGDHVLVHDDGDITLALHDGVVAMIDPGPESNDVGIRLDAAGGEPTIVHPRRRAVHPAPIDRREPCWRCDAIARRHDLPVG